MKESPRAKTKYSRLYLPDFQMLKLIAKSTAEKDMKDK
jgi:hypothetical protein